MEGSTAPASSAHSDHSHPLARSGSVEEPATGDPTQGSCQLRANDVDGPASGRNRPTRRPASEGQSQSFASHFLPDFSEPAETAPERADGTRESPDPAPHVPPNVRDASRIWNFSVPRGSAENPSTTASACGKSPRSPNRGHGVGVPQEANSCSAPPSAGRAAPPVVGEGPVASGDVADVDSDRSGFRAAGADNTAGAGTAGSEADGGSAAKGATPSRSGEATESGVPPSPENSRGVDSPESDQGGGPESRAHDGPTGKGAGANRVYTREHEKKDLASPSAATPGPSAAGGAELLRCDLMWIASGNKGGLITPVEDCELHPIVIIRDRQGRVFDDDEESEENPIGKSSHIFFRWMRGPPRAVCTFHPQRAACLQCVVTLRCFCCYDCFRKGYKQLHKFYRTRGLSSILPHPNSHTYGVPCRPFDWNDFDSNRQFDTQHLALLKQAGLVTAEGEQESWKPVSTCRNYTPSKADVGHQLRLETLVVDRQTLAQLLEDSRSRQSNRRKSREKREAAGAAEEDRDASTGANGHCDRGFTERQAGDRSSGPDSEPKKNNGPCPDSEGTDGGTHSSQPGESARRPSADVSSDGRSGRGRQSEKSEAVRELSTACPDENRSAEGIAAESSRNRRAPAGSDASAGSSAGATGGEDRDGDVPASGDAASRSVLGNRESVDMAEAAAVAWAAASLHDSSHYRQVLTGCCVPTVDTVPRRRRRLASVPHLPPVHGVAAHGAGLHGLAALSLQRPAHPTHEVRGLPDGSLHVPNAHLDAFPGPTSRSAGATRDRLFSPIDDMAVYAPVGAETGSALSDGSSLAGSVAFGSSAGAGSYTSLGSFGDASSFSSSAFGFGRSASGLCTYAPGGGNVAGNLLPSYEANGLSGQAAASVPGGFYQNRAGPSSRAPSSREGGVLEGDGACHGAHGGFDSESDCCLSPEGSFASRGETPGGHGSGSNSRCESRHSSASARDELRPEDAEQFNVSVMTWNVLAELYGTLDAFPHCDAYMLAWPYRRQRILDEILTHNPDVVCLQEVQSEHFEDFFLPELARHGYNGMYKQKTMEIFTSGSGKKSGGKFTMDGCATFYRKSKFTIVDQCGLEFSQLIKQASREQLPRQLQRQAVRRLLKDNVALLLLLEVKNEGDARAAAAAEETERGRDTGTRRSDGNRSSSDSRALSASTARPWLNPASSSSPDSATPPLSRGRVHAATGLEGGGVLGGANRAESENPRGSRDAGVETDAEPVRSTLRANAPAWEASRVFDSLANSSGIAGGLQWGCTSGASSADGGSPSGPRKLLLVANTHIVANPESNDVKIWQAQTLVGMIEKYLLAFRPPTYLDSPCLTPAVVLCGDFNSTPDSAVYQLLVTGRCDRQHTDLASDRHGLLAELNLGHNIPLKSGYAVSKALKDGLDPHDFYALRQSEPEFTNYTGNYTGCLDYLFFTDTMLRVREILEPVDSKQLFREARQLQLLHQALPSPLRPSDHIPLLCKFEWIQ
ncbi:Carbon catabolite repressor protein, related [Neospora caninum Liverpool]|nr:Carbon catabolite repressor protein, related [Neospora caninum Liverpool]CBZ52933.1 Carbon catabolite repressor protein, related [Neospora caninum Liverpool]|eukprot:XP_003882965.1 Carbon catabolite repressor protein, related [Neospora caninum Liverpool]